jgi:CO/xanthine dehydrogenase FAD-binding subunit
MRAYVPEYDLVTPANLNEALALLANEPGKWRPIAGGTDLMVLFEAGKLPWKRLFSIWHLHELRGINVSAEHVTMGALTTYTDVRDNTVLRDEFPLLGEAASWTGGIATQNRGTLGGNIVNASPAADTPPALLVYEAEVQLISSSGARWLPYTEFHTGYKQMQMRNDELLAGIRLVRTGRSWRHYSRKVGTRKAQAISKVCMAALADSEETRIAFGSVAPIPLRCRRTEAMLSGQRTTPALIAAARKTLESEIAPIADIRSTRDYRMLVAQNLLEEFLRGPAA